MGFCLICLELNGDTFPRINVNSPEWMSCNVQRIIEKHLWWWHSKTKNESEFLEDEWICHLCWEQLWSFHTFYVRVEKVHNNFYTQLNECKVQSEGLADETNSKLEKQEEEKECETSLSEDLIPITKRRRGRPRLHNEKLPNIKIEEFSVQVEVKDEDDDLVVTDTEEFMADDVVESPKEFENEDYKGSDSSDSKASSDEEVTLDKPKKRRRVTSKTTGGSSKLNDKGTSSAHLTKRYDDFIAANHELFCSLCHVSLTDFQNLITHFRSEHDTKAFAMCCGKKFFKRAVFVDHLYIHKDPEYFKCQHCGKVLSNRRCLKNHLEWHDVTRKPKFNCTECGKDFFKRGSFEKHKLLHVPEEERQFQCSECDKKFASASLRTQHLKVTHLNKYAKICDICGKPFRERHSFQRHLAEHTGIPTDPIQCDICGMKLTSTYGLNRHKRLRHTEENMQEQICPYCSKVSPNIAAHRSHIQYSHTMQRKHACHLCDKAFRRPKELKEHLSTHTGEALYTCPYCPRTFISNANMHKHRKNEHPKEWEEARIQRLASCQSTVSEAVLNT